MARTLDSSIAKKVGLAAKYMLTPLTQDLYIVLSPLNLVGAETTESLSRGTSAAAACTIGAVRILMGQGGGVGHLGGVKPSGKGKGSSGSSSGSNHCNLQ